MMNDIDKLLDQIRPRRKFPSDALAEKLRQHEVNTGQSDAVIDNQDELETAAAELNATLKSVLDHFCIDHESDSNLDLLWDLHLLAESLGIPEQGTLVELIRAIDDKRESRLLRQQFEAESIAQESVAVTGDEISVYQLALDLWNKGGSKWPEIAGQLGEGVNALRVGTRRYAKKHNLEMRAGKPGRPKK